jgi:signal transduction histidine kinase
MREQLGEERGDLMRSQLEKSDIELTVEDSTEITIHGDQNQLKQVLLNLIRNGAESIVGVTTWFFRSGLR